MARTSKDTKAAARAGAKASSTTGMSTSAQAWAPTSPASAASAAARSSVGARSGGLGIGSPIYEELVAELGDPAA